MLWRWLCVLWLLALPVQAAIPALPVLYVADPLEGLEPVAVFNPDTQKLLNPLTVLPEPLPYFQKQLPLASELELYRNGEIKNRLISGPFREPEARCRGSGSFESRLLHSQAALAPLLAFSADFPGPRKYPGDYPATRFQSVAREMVQDSFRQHGVSGVAQIQMRQLIPFTLENGASIQFAVSAAVVTAGASCPGHSLLLVVEKVGRRHVRRLEKYQGPGSCQSYEFVSSFATGPLIDKILLRGRTPTSHWYEVFQHQAFGGYQLAYRGGGLTCAAKKDRN